MGGPLAFILGLGLLGASAVGKMCSGSQVYDDPRTRQPGYIPEYFVRNFDLAGRSDKYEWYQCYTGVFDWKKLDKYRRSDVIQFDIEKNGGCVDHFYSRDHLMISEYVAEFYLSKLGFKDLYQGFGRGFARKVGLPLPSELNEYDERIMIDKEYLIPYLKHPKVFDMYDFRGIDRQGNLFDERKAYQQLSPEDKISLQIYFGFGYPFHELREIEWSNANRPYGWDRSKPPVFQLDQHTDKMPEMIKPYPYARRVLTEKGVQQVIDLLGFKNI